MRLLKFMFLIAGFILPTGCRQKDSHNGNPVKVELEDFLGMFHPLSLPLNFGDSSLSKKPGDSAVSASVFSQFFPDSVFQKQFGKSSKPRLYASGKLVIKNAETYLFVKALSPARKELYLVCLDKDGKFTTSLPLVVREEDSEISYVSNIDNKYTISVSRLRKDSGGRGVFVRTVYVYGSEGTLTVIMTESNEGKPRISQIYNPIDTLAHKHKYTGDYIQDKRNFISFRDGKNSTLIRFFVHFEKDNGNCKGELKGEARFVSSSLARYIANGDPCSIEFAFSEKNVRMKEIEGCGSHRDIKCYFEGLYLKHKEAVSKPAKAKHR